MKKLIILCGLCVFALNLYSADQPAATAEKPVVKLTGTEATAQLNRIFGNGDEYVKLTKEIDRLNTGKRINAEKEIAQAKGKQQAIIDKIKAVQTDDMPTLQLKARMLEQLKKGRKLTTDEVDRINYWTSQNARSAEIQKNK